MERDIVGGVSRTLAPDILAALDNLLSVKYSCDEAGCVCQRKERNSGLHHGGGTIELPFLGPKRTRRPLSPEGKEVMQICLKPSFSICFLEVKF